MSQARKEAKERGEKLFEGAPCKHGHGNIRYVSTGGCLECGRKSALGAYHQKRSRDLAPAVAQVLGDAPVVTVSSVPDIA